MQVTYNLDQRVKSLKIKDFMKTRTSAGYNKFDSVAFEITAN